MTLCIIIFALTIVGLIICVITGANIKGFPIYLLVTLLGTVLVLACQVLPLDIALKGLWNNSSVNPIKILVLFISMTSLSVFLDEVGFFTFLACYTLKKAGISQLKLFSLLFVVVSILTVFTSNDIIILTFTPFICYFCKRAKLNPLPYLILEFVSANTFSMMLLIGNPTNIYLSLFKDISFGEYLSVMYLPAIFGGVTAFIVLLLLFKKQLATPMSCNYESFKPNTPLVIIGVLHLAICTILLAVAQFINLQMWLITLIFSLSLFIIVSVYKLIKKEPFTDLKSTLKRLPWGLIPFLISMFILVESLNYTGVTKTLANALPKGVFSYGIISTLSANLLNNIPMSVLFGSIINFASAGKAEIFATIIGSNIGAYLTPIGALAGIMWLNILSTHGQKISFLKFMLYGVIVAIPTLLISLLGLLITI